MIFKLNSAFQPIGILDNFESLIWDDKYFSCGNFEFHAPYSLGDASYVYDNSENQVGVIESIEKENMKHVYKGRLLKCLLSNKVINSTCTYTKKSTEYIVKDLVRRFAGQNIQIEENQNRGLMIDALQVTGNNLMEYTDSLLEDSELGARIELDFATGKLTYKVYEGVDNTSKMPMSKEFENIYSFTYTNDRSNFKNFAYVAGEDSGKNRVVVTVDKRVGDEEKLEIYVDARDVQSEYIDEAGEQQTMTETEYKEALYQRGIEKLTEYQIQETIDIDPKDRFQLGEKRTFRDGNLISVQRITERSMAYEDNTVKQSVIFGLQKINLYDKIKREVKK